MLMEDNTRYLVNRIWNKILPPALLCNVFVLIELHVVSFFLISHFCPKAELVVYSAFLPFWFLFAAIECFFAIAGTQLFSICKGAGKHPDAQRVFAEIFTSLVLLVATGMLAAFFLMPCIVRFLEMPQESVPLAVRYGRLLFACGLMDIIVTMLRLFVQADSLPRTGAVISITHAFVLMAGMYVFLCLLHWGMVAYYGFYAVSLLVGIGIYVILFSSRKTTIKLEFRKIRWQTFKELASLSSNNIINNGGVFIISLLTTRWVMAAFGPAAVTILALLSMLASCCEFLRKAYVSSMQSLVGIYRGEGNENGIRLVCRKGFTSSLYLQLGSMLFLLCFPGLLCQWMQVLENFPGEAVMAVRLFALSIPIAHTFGFFTGYYVICGYDRFVIFCSVAGNLLLYFCTTTFFMLILRNERICWWYYPVSWLFALTFFAIAAQWKKRKGNFKDLLLLPQRASERKQYHFLLKNQTDDFRDYRTMLTAFLHKNSVDAKTEERIMHLFEELFLFAGDQVGDRQNALLSIVITIAKQNVELALRYDSPDSCLDSVLNGGKTVLSPDRVAGAKILSRLSDSIYIDRIYGINYVRLTLNSPETI